jgi:hypothetical protein
MVELAHNWQSWLPGIVVAAVVIFALERSKR